VNESGAIATLIYIEVQLLAPGALLLLPVKCASEVAFLSAERTFNAPQFWTVTLKA
jgi:hypothetical protein